MKDFALREQILYGWYVPHTEMGGKKRKLVELLNMKMYYFTLKQ